MNNLPPTTTTRARTHRGVQPPRPADLSQASQDQPADPDAIQAVAGLSPESGIAASAANVDANTSGSLQLPTLLPIERNKSAPARAGAGLALDTTGAGSGPVAGVISRSPSHNTLAAFAEKFTRGFPSPRSQDPESKTPPDESVSPQSSPRESNERASLPRSRSSTRLSSQGSQAAYPLNTPHARAKLTNFSAKEFSAENMHFMHAIQSFDNGAAKVSPEVRHAMLQSLIDTFIGRSANLELNTGDMAAAEVRVAWSEVDKTPPAERDYRRLFVTLDRAVDEILKLVTKDTIKRFAEKYPEPEKDAGLLGSLRANWAKLREHKPNEDRAWPRCLSSKQDRAAFPKPDANAAVRSSDPEIMSSHFPGSSERDIRDIQWRSGPSSSSSSSSSSSFPGPSVASSSSSSTSVGTLGQKNAFVTICQEFMDVDDQGTKLQKLKAIVAHLNSGTVAFFNDDLKSKINKACQRWELNGSIDLDDLHDLTVAVEASQQMA